MDEKSNLFSRRTVMALMGASAAGLTFTRPAWAADWPDRPVTMVVPYGPGASNDTFTRAISQLLSEALGQPFVVDNRPGAGGFTGTNSVVQAEPDGYTFLEMPNSIMGFAPGMHVDFDPFTDLTPIGMLARAPVAMVVPASLPVKTVAEFIDYAKANPDTTFYGFAGVGTTQHQHGELFKKNAGIDIQGVNYKSSADAQTDLVAGRLQLMLVTIASARGQIEAGQLRLLAYSADNYPPGSPEAPTLAEAGVPNMEGAQIWWGLFAPPKLPDDIVTAMNAAVNEALGSSSFEELAARSGATPSPMTPADFTQAMHTELDALTTSLRMSDCKNGIGYAGNGGPRRRRRGPFHLLHSSSMKISLRRCETAGSAMRASTIRAASSRPALIGCCTKVMGLPCENTIARRRYSSSRLPSTKPMRKGAGSQSSLWKM
jgi:tripartite-type tricarboxylate transporter receptor subunit TctC